MAGIYNADIYCDDCIEKIKDDIAQELWDKREGGACPDGTPTIDFESCKALNDYLREMDETTYDSGEYPKYASDDEESDSPQHCGSHEDCEYADDLGDGHKIGCFLENPLTSEGYDYVKEAVAEDVRAGCDDSVAVVVWAPFYDIEVGNDDADFDED